MEQILFLHSTVTYLHRTLLNCKSQKHQQQEKRWSSWFFGRLSIHFQIYVKMPTGTWMDLPPYFYLVPCSCLLHTLRLTIPGCNLSGLLSFREKILKAGKIIWPEGRLRLFNLQRKSNFCSPWDEETQEDHQGWYMDCSQYDESNACIRPSLIHKKR